VLGYLAAIVISGIESAAVVGGFSVLAAALYSLGVPKNSIISYETTLAADGYLVMAHGTSQELAEAKSILGTTNPVSLDTHQAAETAEQRDPLVHVTA
jgi:hypothetical protein